MSRRLLASIVLAVTAASVVVPARRAEAGPGIRFGLTDDPDTIFLGFFYEGIMGGSRRGGLFVLEPGLDVGFHNDTDYWTLRGNLRGKYFVSMGGRAAIYPLVGISIYHINYDCGDRDCDDTSAGLDLGGGLTFGVINIELFLGLDNDRNSIPDATFSVGFKF